MSLQNDSRALGINAPDVAGNVFDVMVSDVMNNIETSITRVVKVVNPTMP